MARSVSKASQKCGMTCKESGEGLCQSACGKRQRREVIIILQSLKAIIEGNSGRLRKRARRYVFKGCDIGAKHITEKSFHETPDSNIVEKLRANYSGSAFFMQFYLSQITKLTFSSSIPDAQSELCCRYRSAPRPPALLPTYPVQGR